MKSLYYFTLILAMLVMSCSDSPTEGPNELGGSTNVDFVEVGDWFTPTLIMDGNPELNAITNRIVVQSNNNGIVTLKGVFTFDTDWTNAMDKAFGIDTIPLNIKLAGIYAYLKRFGGTLDTTDKSAMKVTVILKGKVTTEGIQEFMTSGGDESKPFTIVKYNANVGDKYQFTNKDGKTITREVVAKSTTDDFSWGGMYIKVIQVEEVQLDDDPISQKITYYGNHKFGLVCIKVDLRNGKVIKAYF